MGHIWLGLIVLLGSGAAAHAEPWCVGKKPTADMKTLSCLQSLDECGGSITVAQGVHRILNELRQKRELCPKCPWRIAGEETFYQLYGKPFLLTQVKPSGPKELGDFEVYLVFRERPRQQFQMAMSCTGSGPGGYELEGGPIDLDPASEIERLIKKLSRPEYTRFWTSR